MSAALLLAPAWVGLVLVAVRRHRPAPARVRALLPARLPGRALVSAPRAPAPPRSAPRERLGGRLPAWVSRQLAFAALDPVQNLVQPVGPLAARRALAARLVAVEVQQVLREPHHAGGVVEHDDRRRPEQRPGLLDGVEIKADVKVFR